MLLDGAGEVVKRPPQLRSDSFMLFPVSWPVKLFLLVGVRTCVEDSLSRWTVELRDYRGRTVDGDVTLRRVREMAGSKENPAHNDRDKLFCELKDELEDSLGVFDPDIDFRIGHDPEFFLQALVNHMLDRYDMDAIESTFELFNLDIRQKKEKEARH